MGKKVTTDKDSAYFWSSASQYLNNELSNIRKKSLNTVEAYRRSLMDILIFWRMKKLLTEQK